ncbi:MAG: DUF4249 domain-containing protein [Bacteroidetes bacterium]|nr:MAG: DUF4249 domain-containing protein [Bacteroidota bacterium]
MKNLKFILFIAICCIFSSCEDVIKVSLDEGTSQLTVDGWITDQAGVQNIRLTKTKPYFDNSAANPAKNVSVKIADNDGMIYDFTDPDGDGNYTWTPKNNEKLGKVGKTYTLTINFEGETYQASSKLNRVPVIDSVGYKFQEKTIFFQKEGYLAEFYATDLKGIGDCYRVKYYRNGKLMNRPIDLQAGLGYDGVGNAGSNSDATLFFLPLRQAVNQFDSLYQTGETVKVELYSITEDAFNFFTEVVTQINNGGLFATPIANVRTNIKNTNPNGKKATGYFGASAVSTAQTTIQKRK